MKKFFYAVTFLLSMSVIIISCGGNNSSSNYYKEVDEESEPDYSEVELSPEEIYSSWQDCISLELQPRIPMGIGIEVKNICEHHIECVTVTIYCDGITRDFRIYNLRPGEEGCSVIPVTPDADVEILDIQIEWKK